MHQFTFGLIQPFEINCVQQMIQGTEFSSMSFNRMATPIFMARDKGSVAGFAYGQRGYGDNAHVLTIQGTYLRNQFNDDAHEHELHLAFINWAAKNLGVTHYKSHEFDAPKSICISHYMPPQMPAAPVVEEVSATAAAATTLHKEYAYG